MDKLNRKSFLYIIITLILTSCILVYLLPYYKFTWGFTTVTSILAIVYTIDVTQKKHSIRRNFPILGRLRWLFEEERSKIQQYFIENDINGTPFNKEVRSDIYQKSKLERNNTPFGTQEDVYRKDYKSIKHSMFPTPFENVIKPRVIFGTDKCKQKFETSIFNISAMSYGSLSDKAIKSLNIGASIGGFYHNTGEGGISPYHLNGGDICFQIGTGYFGCGSTIDNERTFNDDMFVENVNKESVKMVEIKLSQGAKPGHGGILPKIKNTEEIATIRGIEPYTEVKSPPHHSAFSNLTEMVEFIQKLRELSNGKPIGIKLCVGSSDELDELFATFKKLDNYPDFITIDGSEGGTGAAPLVWTNKVGIPLFKALEYKASNDGRLLNFMKMKNIKLVASGKLATTFDILKAFSFGIDSVQNARGFMLSMGCIQARECNSDKCPVGIATQNKNLIKGLDPTIKSVRVANYHNSIIHELMELISTMGLTDIKEVDETKIYSK